MDSKYLGNPLFVKRKKVESFNYTLDKMKGRLESWKARTLSWVGRATLVRSTLNAIPNYTMSLFKLPATICRKID